jgi:hypothetical protein
LPPTVQLCAEARVIADGARARKERTKRIVSFEIVGCGCVVLVGFGMASLYLYSW